jgi:hypothetical protein
LGGAGGSGPGLWGRWGSGPGLLGRWGFARRRCAVPAKLAGLAQGLRNYLRCRAGSGEAARDGAYDFGVARRNSSVARHRAGDWRSW